MPTDPSDAALEAARTAARAVLGAVPTGPVAVRFEDTNAGGVACLVQVWCGGLPTAKKVAGAKRAGSRRAECRADILAVVAAAGKPLIRKAILKALRDAGKKHGEGTVAKALAELTGDGGGRELRNPGDKKGYRLKSWPEPPGTPSLFD